MNAALDAAPFEAVRPLPESIGSAGSRLFLCDAVSGIVAIAVCGLLFGSAVSAFFVVAATLIAGAVLGRYHRCFAVLPHDEWYAAIAVAIPGGLAGVLLCFICGFSWSVALAACVTWSLVAGAAALYLHRARRRGLVFAGMRPRVRAQPRTPQWRLQQSLIRGIDIVVASVALVVLAPVLALVALLVAVRDGLPVIFAQTRVGKDDREFRLYKFRTMRAGAGTQWAHAGDDRITPLGRFLRRTSLDELPQLWNVVRGDMSIVGPRPEMHEYSDRFSRQYQFYSQRHMIRPGITGWAQVYLPRQLQPDDAPVVMQYDLFYVDNAGLYVYFQCLAKTAFEIFFHRAL